MTCIYLQTKDPHFKASLKLPNFAQLILTIVANQAGCERTFTDLKIKQA
jgi:hypothetical protein